ncbi:hypothetical protein ESCO_004035 [Escovopsis weberi]|uniref:Uncharacterized protein n=1 Tax=Escovopsis weberi TaxID=150374 RepID=A0A0M8N6W0_ESCWE|nr:hypothetical protein ESCO_004035 [Escovopsis weberi]
MAYPSRSLLPLLAGVAAAQHALELPNFNHPAIKLLDTSASAYQVCTSASSFIAGCYNKFGGETGLFTADPLALNECVCCAGTVDVAPAYSVCSSFLASEAPLLSTQVSAFGDLYSICEGNTAICASAGAGSGSSPASKTTPPTASNPSVTAPGAVRPSQTNSQPTITSGPSASGAVPIQACTDMVDYFTSCEFNTPGFKSMPFGQQASCYCCATSNGRVFSTNALDQAASSCAAWAKTGEPDTIYPVASTFASFCKVLGQGICESHTTAAPANPFDGLAQTKTTAAAAGPTSADHPSSADSSRKASYAAGLVAVAAFAALLS